MTECENCPCWFDGHCYYNDPFDQFSCINEEADYWEYNDNEKE